MTDEVASLRSRAVSRSVDPAREAAEARVQRFLDTALELMQSPGGEDFTIQKLVERSGLSLRSFYHHFAGKYELLVAVFEESIRATAAHLSTAVESASDPLDGIRIFVTEYYRMCRGHPSQPDTQVPSRAFGNFAHQLLYNHPSEAGQAFVPLVQLLRRLLDEAAAADAIDPTLDREQVAGVVLQAIMFNAFATTITGSSTDEAPGRGDLLWQLLVRGLTGQPPPT
jgi:AcrR family transcriptional regulator